jgi:hypothetical protein
MGDTNYAEWKKQTAELDTMQSKLDAVRLTLAGTSLEETGVSLEEALPRKGPCLRGIGNASAISG